VGEEGKKYKNCWMVLKQTVALAYTNKMRQCNTPAEGKGGNPFPAFLDSIFSYFHK